MILYYEVDIEYVYRKVIKFILNYEKFYCDIDIKICMKSNVIRN